MASWKGSSLSQARKCQLVKSILQNLPIYALSLFTILGKYAERMEKIQRDFLWMGTDRNKRYPLVAWDKVCLPKKNGGLGIRKITHINKALLAKKIWHIFSSMGEWRDTVVNTYIKRPSFQFTLFSEDLPRGSVVWNGFLKARDLTNSKVSWKLRNGENILFWSDNWLSQGSLINNPTYGVWANDCINLFGHKVSNYKTDQGWKDLSIILEELKPIMIMFNSLSLSTNKDELVWRDNANGLYSVASGYFSLWSTNVSPPWSRAWLLGLMPKVNFFFGWHFRTKISPRKISLKEVISCPVDVFYAKTSQRHAIICSFIALVREQSGTSSPRTLTIASAFLPTSWTSSANDKECLMGLP